MKYVLLLRGINVGGHKKVPMIELKKMLSEMGFRNTKTLLNSGNAVFETQNEKEPDLIRKIEIQFKTTFGFDAPLILRTDEAMRNLMELDPFHGTTTTKETRLYVSFLSEKSTSDLPLPYSNPKSDFKILQKTDREIFSVLNIKTSRSVDAMKFLEKEYGKNSTTRNWNTVVKIANLMTS